jgi:hypothetical protein
MMLYHYTSLTGLIGILSSRNIWATHVSYLNDASEFFHGLDYAKNLAGAIYADDDYHEGFGWAARHALDELKPGNLFIASFSERPDLLSQWRGYCPAGAGVCLGFEKSALEQFCVTQGYELQQCMYDDNQKISYIRTSVEECLNRFPKIDLSREDFEKLDNEAKLEYMHRSHSIAEQPAACDELKRLTDQLSSITPLFKNQGFHEEAEWRIVANEQDAPKKFRVASTYAVPYIELSIFHHVVADVLKEIILGPNPNQRRCEDSVKLLLDEMGIQDVQVIRSKTPFNNW